MATKITWDEVGKRFYETGIDHVVLYPIQEDGHYSKGVAWNGITNISESPSGAEANPFYADNIKYLNLMSAEEFGLSLEAYSYPPEFAECDGSAELQKGVSIGQQPRKIFGLSYRTKLGNDTKFDEYGYKLHFVYGCQASPSERAYNTINDSPEPATLSWEVTTTPVDVTDHKPTSLVTIDCSQVDPDKLAEFEEIIYGKDDTEARLPLPDEIAQLLTNP